jgi:predicted transcriptional regulator
MISSEEVQKKVIASRKKSKIPLNGIAPSNIRRQIKRLKDIQLIENIKNEYRITEFDNLSTVFEERILDLYLPQITKRVKDYCKAIK